MIPRDIEECCPREIEGSGSGDGALGAGAGAEFMGAASTYLMASAMIPNMTSIILFQYRLQGEILKKISLRKV